MARILVADDEEGVRTFLAEALEVDGHVVAQAEDGQAAALLLAAQSFDVLVTDLKMPRLDGMGLVRKVRAEQPDVEVIMLTAYGSVDTAVEAMKLGAFDYLQKPVSSPAELRLLVGRAIERRQLRTLADRSSREAEGELKLTFGDPVMASVMQALQKVARTSTTVLLTGESGTGKEVAARAVHRWSARTHGPFVAVNCAALSEQLLESELFGHEKGAFTGATARRRGRVELAHGGTFFLDEVAELKPELQAKLLRVLQERTFERVGGSQTVEADVRWVAATNRDLRAQMEAGRFREDLYHRLAVFPVRLPPLRERRCDIVPLAEVLLERICSDLKRAPLALSDDAKLRLTGAEWSGNVRALANVLERAAILVEGDLVSSVHLWIESAPGGLAVEGGVTSAEMFTSAEPAAGVALAGGDHGAPMSPRPLADLEQEAIRAALASVEGNRRRAAALLGIGLRTLYDKLKRYQIE